MKFNISVACIFITCYLFSRFYLKIILTKINTFPECSGMASVPIWASLNYPSYLASDSSQEWSVLWFNSYVKYLSALSNMYAFYVLFDVLKCNIFCVLVECNLFVFLRSRLFVWWILCDLWWSKFQVCLLLVVSIFCHSDIDCRARVNKIFYLSIQCSRISCCKWKSSGT